MSSESAFHEIEDHTAGLTEYGRGYEAGYVAGAKAAAPDAYRTALAEGMRIAQAYQQQARRWQRLAGERARALTAAHRRLRKAETAAARQTAPAVTSVTVQGQPGAEGRA